MADSEENGSDARKHEKVLCETQNWVPSICFDPRGPRKSYSNIMERDPSSEKKCGDVVPVLCNLSRGIFRKSTKESIDVGSL